MGIVNWLRSQWDRATALVALIVGILAMLLGWIGVSGHSYVADQMPYVVSGALFGIFMVGIAAAIWISADLRDEWRELRGVRMELRAQRLGASIEDGPSAGMPSAGMPSAGVPMATVPDMEHTASLPPVHPELGYDPLRTDGGFA